MEYDAIEVEVKGGAREARILQSEVKTLIASSIMCRIGRRAGCAYLSYFSELE